MRGEGLRCGDSKSCAEEPLVDSLEFIQFCGVIFGINCPHASGPWFGLGIVAAPRLGMAQLSHLSLGPQQASTSYFSDQADDEGRYIY
jgi:hypothetical protein